MKLTNTVTSALSESEFLQRKGVEHDKSSKRLGKADEYWELRSRLSASYDDLKHTKVFLTFFSS